jgi:hypothetical protein
MGRLFFVMTRIIWLARGIVPAGGPECLRRPDLRNAK